MRKLIEKKMSKVSSKMVSALRPHLKYAKEAAKEFNDGYEPRMSDKEWAQSIWDTARAAGWKEDEVIDQPYSVVRDVLAIWR